MDQFVKRRVSITIEEEREGDHQEFAPVVAKVLRELADLTDSGCAGKTAREVYCRNGVIATIVEDDITGVCIPYRDSGVKGLRFEYVEDAKKPTQGGLIGMAWDCPNCGLMGGSMGGSDAPEPITCWRCQHSWPRSEARSAHHEQWCAEQNKKSNSQSHQSDGES